MGISIQELYLSKVPACSRPQFRWRMFAQTSPSPSTNCPGAASSTCILLPFCVAYPLKLGSHGASERKRRLVICVGSRVKVMRKHLLSIVIVGFLLLAGSPARATQPATDPTTQAPVAVQRVAVPSRGLPDEAAMVLIGAALIALAAAVRRVA